jgi:hypothetical protein
LLKTYLSPQSVTLANVPVRGSLHGPTLKRKERRPSVTN